MSDVMTRSNTVPVFEYDQLSPEEFDESYYRPQMPVLVRNAISDWNANHWSREYFRSCNRDPLVEVQYNGKGIFNPVNDDPELTKPQRFYTRFSKAADLIYSPEGDNHYIRQWTSDKWPELADDIKRPRQLGTDKSIIVTNFWLGGRSCKTPLHYDRPDNFLIQVKGHKRLAMFRPAHHDNVYPALDTHMPFMSALRPTKPSSST